MWYNEVAKPTEYQSKGYFYLQWITVTLLRHTQIWILIKMQIPTEYGVRSVLAFSVGLATIGVCVFCAVYFGSRTFLFFVKINQKNCNETLSKSVYNSEDR